MEEVQIKQDLSRNINFIMIIMPFKVLFKNIRKFKKDHIEVNNLGTKFSATTLRIL